MPHYYLHQIAHGDRIDDLEGGYYEDLEAAVTDAVIGAREIMASRILEGKEPNSSQIEIADETGKVLRTLQFHEAADGKSFDEEGRPRVARPAE